MRLFILLTQFALITSFLLPSCSAQKNKQINDQRVLTQEEKDYWYSGEAEISSYKLTQSRYGELHEGSAVLVFVTEPFSTSSWTKSDNPSKEDISVLKLNFTKKFVTGIYPYSMLTSIFLPFKNPKNSLKVSSSSQEWCGHTYMELRNTGEYQVEIKSYFEGESKKISLQKTYLEDDFWSKIRLDPNKLPTGKYNVIPSFFFLRLLHQKAQPYECVLSLKKDESTTSYTIHYPKLKRTLVITFENSFPFKIVSWEETYFSGWGENKKKLVSKATKVGEIKTDYWNKHFNSDTKLRDKLNLD